MTTPLHPHAVWNPAFRPNTNTNTTTSLPPLLPLSATTTHPSNTHLHNVTLFTTAAAAAASTSKLAADADTDLKSIPLGNDDTRDLEAGMGGVVRRGGVKRRVKGWWTGVACLVLMFFTVSLGGCFAFGG